jgi:hypothetical protein
MSPAKDLTPSEIIEAIRADDLRAKVRNMLTDWHALIDLAFEEDVSPIERRRMELVEAEEITMAVIKHTSASAIAHLPERGVVPTMCSDEVLKLTREPS